MLALFGFMALNRFVAFRKANTVIILLSALTVFGILANFLLKILN
jgi:hypothetical protein